MSESGEVRYLFTGRIEERDGAYVVEIPEREIEDGDLEAGEVARLGFFGAERGDEASGASDDEPTASDDASADDASAGDVVTDATPDGEAASSDGGGETAVRGGVGGVGGGPGSPESLDEVSLDEEEPPVSEGDTRRVEITDVGEQGDGLARIDRGYIVFVPETEPGDTVQIEITDAKENFGFGKVVE